MMLLAPAPHDPPDEVTIPLTTFIYTTVSLSAAIVVVMVVAVGVVTGLVATVKKLQLTTTESSASHTSNVGDDVSAVVVPEYEEIILHEGTSIHLTDNAAYRCNS
jgi:hypothetical protein